MYVNRSRAWLAATAFNSGTSCVAAFPRRQVSPKPLMRGKSARRSCSWSTRSMTDLAYNLDSVGQHLANCRRLRNQPQGEDLSGRRNYRSGDGPYIDTVGWGNEWAYVQCKGHTRAIGCDAQTQGAFCSPSPTPPQFLALALSTM